MSKLETHYQKEGDTYLIEIKLNQIRQLFNSLDPSPFLERDLDDNAETYIVQSVGEFPLKTDLKLVFYLPEEAREEAKQLLPEALHHYFDYRKEAEAKRLHSIWRQGRISLALGLCFLFVCLSLSELVSRWGENTFLHFLEEGLSIGGWVAMWRPIEILLYEWWPIRRAQKIFEKLSRLSIEVR